MTNSKTFRLFISSTFSDFKREREVLQGKVFPHIKAYAAQLGYIFQPIDLRWGVSNEAQLDQKTLELCLDEVKACKTFKYPNFLVMLGDRYGWVPLPYAIEVHEFEILCTLMTEQEKQDLTDWYVKDLNQLPASYILKERNGEFEAFEYWEKEEIKLRNILQRVAETAFENSNINSEQRKKYSTSATEAEVEEGIISYLKPTTFQKTLLEEAQISPEIDVDHIFGFFRSIEPSSKIEKIFIGDDTDKAKAKAFSDKVSEVLVTENRLHTEVKQIEKDKLDETYLQDFQERVIQFLESKINAQKKQDDRQLLSPLKMELKEQEYFAKSKRKIFLGQKKLLIKIEDYIANDNQQPLVIYGKSGSGKSALMAKAIEYAKSNTDKKVLYRFVGATENSTTSGELLASLFDEFEALPEKNQIFPLNKKDELSQIVACSLVNFELLESDIVIFIDAINAIDLLINNDGLFWLPNKLRPNIKIVISVLKDEVYPKESFAYEILKGKIATSNFICMPIFASASQLLLALLSTENRTLQEIQLESFECQFKLTGTPLYTHIAAQNLKNIDSSSNQDFIASRQANNLKSRQQIAVQEYIDNLSEINHHEPAFINRVLGYLFASRDGLSESQLLELINTDKAFIKSVASEQYHQNTTSELPLIHWSRLVSKLKPFLSQKKINDQSVMFFSQREFSELIKQSAGAKLEHESLITAIQVLITTNSKNSNILSSWEKLYLKVCMYYYTLYQDDETLSVFITFLASQEGKSAHDLKRVESSSELNKIDSIAFSKCHYFYTKYFYLLDKTDHFNRNWYMMVLKELSAAFKNYGKEDNALSFDCKAYKMAMDAYKKYNQSPKDYLGYGNNLAGSYIRLNQLEDAETILSDIYPIIQELFYDEYERLSRSNMSNTLGLSDWKDLYIVIAHNLATFYNKSDEYAKSKVLLNEVITLTEVLLNSDPYIYVSRYVSSLSTLADIYIQHESEGISKGLVILTKVSIVLDKYIDRDKHFLVDEFIKNCLDLAYIQEFQHDFELALSNLDKVKPVLTQMMLKDESEFLDNQYLDYLVSSFKVNFHLQSSEPSRLKAEVLNFVETKKLQGEKVVRYLNEMNSMLPKTENEGLEGLQRINNAEINARNLPFKVIFFCNSEQENRIKNNVKAILTNLDFTDDTPYEIVTIYSEKELRFAETIIKSKIELPCLVYFFEGSIEFVRSMDKISTTNVKATFGHWLDLSKYIADNDKSHHIDFEHFFIALSYIQLDTKWNKFFSKMFQINIDSLPVKSNSESCIEYGKSISDIGITEDCHNFLLAFSKLLNDEPMGYLR